MYHYQGCAHSGQQQPPLNKMTTTTTNSLTSTKIRISMNKMLSIASYFTQNKVCTRNPRHSLSIDIKFQNNDIKMISK